MRRSSSLGGVAAPSLSLLTTALLLLSDLIPHTTAFPFQRSENQEEGFLALVPRQCNLYCGWQDRYCCGPGTNCITSNDVAMCTPANAGWGVYTTTWTETRTYTSTITPAGGVGGGGPLQTNALCQPQNPGESECGSICCAADQVCAFKGQCVDRDGGPPIVTTLTNGVVTTQYSAPYRVTSATITGVFTTGTGTVLPVTGGTGGSLSPGAIAGIVIGVLAGIALLILICFCCIARGLWHAIFGRKKKSHSRERVEVVEERYSRHGSRVPSAHSRRTRHSGWFGAGGSDHRRHEEKSSGKRWLGLAAAAGTLLALLNLRRDKKKSAHKPRSRDSYYSYSYTGSSPSSSSSGRNSRRTGGTRHSRSTRH